MKYISELTHILKEEFLIDKRRSDCLSGMVCSTTPLKGKHESKRQAQAVKPDQEFLPTGLDGFICMIRYQFSFVSVLPDP